METIKTYNSPRMTERGNKHMKGLTFYLLPDLLRRFKIRCAMDGVPMTKVVERLIKEYLSKKPDFKN